MNKEVKIAIVLLLFIVGLIAYLEMTQNDAVINHVEPIEDIILVPEPVVKVVKKNPPVRVVVAPPIPKVVDPAPKSVILTPPPAPVQPKIMPTVVKKPMDSSEIAVESSIPSTYRVKKGDTVSAISERVLGSIHFQKSLLEANPELVPSQLVAGIELVMPPRSTLESMAMKYNERKEGDYEIQKGDNLYKISKKAFGSSKHVKSILDLNPNLDPRKLVVGSKIKLPELP
jgi:LysM repeat protein